MAAMIRLSLPRLRASSATPLERAAAAALLLTVVAGAPVSAQSAPFGPLTAEEGSPLQRVTYTHVMEGAEVTPHGTFTGDLWLGYSNVFEQDSSATHVLFLDFERLITAATVRWGVTEGLEVGGRVTLETTGGGVLDGFVSWWHNRLNLGNANRDKYPQDQYAQRLVDRTGNVRLDAPSRFMALEDVRLFAKYRVYESEDRRRLLSVRGAVRIPTQDNGVSRERTDVALMLLGQTTWGPVYLHGMLGAGTLRATPDLDPMLRDASAFFTVAAEYPLAPWVSGVLQYSVASPTTQGFGDSEIDSPPMNIVFGLSGRMGDTWRWDASFQEDIPADTPAVDFTLGLRLSRSW